MATLTPDLLLQACRGVQVMATSQEALGLPGEVVLRVPPMAPAQADEWRALAAVHFAGDIVLGDDLTTVDL